MLTADAKLGDDVARFLCVVPNPEARFPCARRGEVGLEESYTLATRLREAIEQDKNGKQRPIIAIVDVKSQAYGRREETAAIFLATAMAADAYASARMSALQSFQLRSLEDSAERMRAVRASLQFLELAPDRITFPLLAAVYRAPLGKIDFSVFLAGRSGVFKTALAALCQQHFGATMDASGLPAGFSSTENALERLAFEAKDALLVVDDFVPVEMAGCRGSPNGCSALPETARDEVGLPGQGS